MADTNEEGKGIRTVINFPPTTGVRLKRLKEYLEATSYIAVIVVALRLLEICVDVIKNGGRIVQIDRNGKEIEVAIPKP